MRNGKGELYRKCAPGAAMKAMKKTTRTIKGWRIHRSTEASIVKLSKHYNATLRGWINYYGRFWYRFSYRIWSTFQSRLIMEILLLMVRLIGQKRGVDCGLKKHREEVGVGIFGSVNGNL